MQKAPNASKRLFSPLLFRQDGKRGRRSASKRPRRNEPPQATSLILCAHFFLSKPQAEFAVWVLWRICSNLQSRLRRASIPFWPFGTFPLLEGGPFSAAFPLLPAKTIPAGGGRKNRPPGPQLFPLLLKTIPAGGGPSARSTRTFCTPQNKNAKLVHIAAGSALVGGYFVIFNVLSIKSLNFAGE